MSDSLIHNLSSTSTVGNSDYFPIDIYNSNDGLYYTYKVSYLTLQNLLGSGITGSFASQFTSLQNSINTANSQLTNKVNRSGGDSMNGNYSITGSLSTTGSIETFAALNVHSQKIVNLGTPTDDYDSATKIYVDGAITSVTGLIPDISNKLNITGGAMSGSLSAYADPTNPNEVSNKRYVDNKTSLLSNYLPLSGGTMTGGISAGGWRIVNIASPVASTDAATRGYVDAQLGGGNSKYPQSGGALDGSIDLQNLYYVINAPEPVNAKDLSNKNYIDKLLSARDTGIIGRLPLSGGTMTGTLNAGNNYITNVTAPSNGGDATNKTYVDAFLSKSGGTMTGNISLGGSYSITNVTTPSNGGDATNKTYVDGLVAGGNTGVNARLPLSGGTMTGGIILHSVTPAGSTSPTSKSYVDGINTTLTNTFASYLPLAGGTMAGAINLGTYKITNLGTPTVTTDAATKAYADTKLSLAGGTMTGGISAGGWRIINLGTPTLGTDAATKTYVDSMLPLAGGTMTGTLILKGFGETVSTNDATGAVAINLALANTFKLKLTGNVTGFTVTNIPTGGCSFTVIVEQGTSTAYTLAYAINESGTNPKWAGGSGAAPIMTSTVNKIDVFSFTTYDGGTTWLGFNGGQNY